jgi:ribosomal protein S13
MLYDGKKNVIRLCLLRLLPIHKIEHNKIRKIIVTDYPTNSSSYVDIGRVFGASLLRYNYGIGKYLSELYVLTLGMNLRTEYYFYKPLFDVSYVVSVYKLINKVLYSHWCLSLKKKFDEHTYRSTSYLNRFPCRGQRRRCNASTPNKLHLISKFSALSAKKEAPLKIRGNTGKKIRVRRAM